MDNSARKFERRQPIGNGEAQLKSNTLTETQIQCSNCQTKFSGQFCPSCGQKHKEYQPTFNEFILTLWDDFVSVDAKLVNTFKVLFKPGQYTVDWLTGKQQRYVHPVRLYIVLSIIYSGLLFIGLEGQQYLTEFVSGVFYSSQAHGEEIVQNSSHYIQFITLIAMPVVILVSQLYNRGFPLIRSVFFVVNIYTVFTILSIALLLVSNGLALFNISLDPSLIVILLSLIFTIFSARIVYALSWIKAIVKTLLLMSLYLVFIASITGITAGYFEAHQSSNEDATMTETLDSPKEVKSPNVTIV